MRPKPKLPKAKAAEVVYSLYICLLTLAIPLPSGIKPCSGLVTPPTSQVQCKNYRSQSCGCPEFANPNAQPSTSFTQSDSAAGHIETDEDGIEYIVVDDMMFRRTPPVHPKVQSDYVDSNYQLDLKFWPGGNIFYMIDPSFPPRYIEELTKAMKAIEDNVGKKHLEFHKAQTPSGRICRSGYMYIRRAREYQCRAEVGMRPTYTQVWLHPDGCPGGTIQHEILHALGRYHEQCRPDRDKHVILNPDNMAAQECSNFYLINSKDESLREPYDSASIMHYGSCHFSCNGKYSMVKKDGSYISPNRNSMTKLDIQKMRRLYPEDFKVPYMQSMCPDKLQSGESGPVRISKSLALSLACLVLLAECCIS